MNKMYTLLLCLGYLTNVFGQSNFKEDRIANDPVDAESALEVAEKMDIHQKFLDNATQSKDTLKQIYGNIYLYYDCLKDKNFTEASQYILEAEKLAISSGNPIWQGWVTHRKGALYVYLRNFEEALKQYKIAAEYCGIGRDSQCVALSLEQVSSMYGQLKTYEKAHEYFQLAMPLLEKYCDSEALSVSLSNYGSLLTYQKKAEEALPYFERALEINKKLNDPYREAQYMHNIGEVKLQLKQYDQALAIYQHCMEINQENQWPERLIYNYHGISEAYRKKNDFENAYLYLKKYYSLKDSIIGVNRQRKIAELEVKYDSQNKELALQKSQAALRDARYSLQSGIMLLLLVLLVVAFGLWRWRLERQLSKSKLADNQANLDKLTQILLKKNTLLSQMEEQLSTLSEQQNLIEQVEGFEENFYNQRILTEEDWLAFKGYFEKTYPGYLLRIRSTFPTVTEAEERLFLFIKLKLTRKEAAAILGISAASVKKTRNRLRKRLGLDEETSLEEFIQRF